MATSGEVKALIQDHIRNSVKHTVATKILNRLKAETPVLTGRARAGWKTKIGSAGGAGADVGIQLETPKSGNDIFIVNAVPYIRVLNSGSSDQAQPLFIERIVAQVTEDFK